MTILRQYITVAAGLVFCLSSVICPPGSRAATQGGRGPQPNIARELVAPHKDLGRPGGSYAQESNPTAGWKVPVSQSRCVLRRQLFPAGEEIGS